MSLRFNPVHSRGRRWFSVGSAWTKGHADYNGAVYADRSLAQLVDKNGADLPPLLSRLRGEFAIVVRATDGRYTAAVDRIRSIPIFYSGTGTKVGDDAASVALKDSGSTADDIDKLCFLLQGTTLAGRTLLHGVKQLRAGEFVTLKSGSVEVGSYYELGADRDTLAGSSQKHLIDLGIALIERAFRRMVNSSSGPFVVPLSGGLDSRLVAAMLKRLGRSETLCYTYGDRRSFDATSSLAVAERLGLRWAFVPYTHRQWNQWSLSSAFTHFGEYASQFSSIEHEQDWPAVLTLSDDGWIPVGSVFVPGHSGDFLAGSHLPKHAFDLRPETTPVEWIVQKYLTQWPISGVDSSLIQQLRDTVSDALTGEEYFRKFDDYGWRQRQAMMIVNSVRSYEFHGYDWRLPLWDEELITFWTSLPVEQRKQKRLYHAILSRLLGDLMGIPFESPQDRGVATFFTRFSDHGLHRYGLFSGPRQASALRPIQRLITQHDPIIERVVGSWKRLPVLRARINGLLALRRLQSILTKP